MKTRSVTVLTSDQPTPRVGKRPSSVVAASVIALCSAAASWSSVGAAMAQDGGNPPPATSAYSKTLDALERMRPASTAEPTVTNAFIGTGLQPAQLRHLPPHPLGTRLAGESDARTWPFYVGATQVGKPSVFRLSYMNAVAVMPEASTIDIKINGELLRTVRIMSSVEPTQVDIEVPSELLALGYNAVTIAARQRHRVDCSADATFELWTDIVENGTGFVADGLGYNIQTLADLPAVTLAADGKVRIRALLPDAPSDEHLTRFFDLAQMVTLAGDFSSPVIEIGEGFGPGIDIFVGTTEELRARAPDLYAELSGPGPFHVVSIPETGTLFLAMVTDQPLTSDTLRASLPISDVRGTELGLQALAAFSPARVFEGRRTTLRAMGFFDEEFTGRLYRRAFNVTLSPDFYPADYDVVKLNLSAAYASGLSRRSGLTVRVNGITNTAVPFGNVNGNLFENKGIELALSAFKAGRNTIEIEASLTRDDDTADCPVGATARAEDPRFMLSPASSIDMPAVANFGLLPDLGNTLRSGFPHVGADTLGETRVFITQRDHGTLEAAGSIIAHLAGVAGRPLNFSVQTGLPRGSETNAIIVGALDQMAPVTLQNLSFVDVARTRIAWSNGNRGPRLSPGGETIEVDETPTGALGEIGSGDVDEDLAAQELRAFRQQWMGRAADDARFPMLHRMQEMVTGWFADVSDPTAKDLPRRLNGETASLIVTQNLSPTGQGVWTVVTARNSQDLASEVERFLRPEPISLTVGQAVGYSARTADVINAGIPEDRSAVLGGRSFTNMRLVIAGWLSNNPLVYLFLITTAMGVGGVAANRFLKTSGRQDGHLTGTGEHG